MKIPPVGAELFHPDGRTIRRCHFSQFCRPR